MQIIGEFLAHIVVTQGNLEGVRQNHYAFFQS